MHRLRLGFAIFSRSKQPKKGGGAILSKMRALPMEFAEAVLAVADGQRTKADVVAFLRLHTKRRYA